MIENLHFKKFSLPAFVIAQLLFVLITGLTANAQIYSHNFGTTTISTHPYTVAPATLNTNLSGSSWSNTIGTWTSNVGVTGQAIQVNTPSGTTTIALTFTVANNFQATITSFNFWRQRSNSGPANWAMAINGTPVGNGSTPTNGTAIGVTPVSSPITGLTGTVTVTLTLSGASGGNFRLDDFTLNGSVTSNCNSATITSFTPATGPAGTIVKITGSGFNNAASVKFNGVTATDFTINSNTEIIATIPAGNTTGSISVTDAGGCAGVSVTNFTTLTSNCNSSTDIFISELYDETALSGGMIELYNPTNSTITFNGNYVLQRYGNITDPSPTAGYVLVLPGSIGPGMTYLIAGTTPQQCSIPFVTTIGSGFNGNDKFELLKNGSLIDVVHVPYTAPGFTLRRKPDAIAPAMVYNINDWINTDNETCSNLGTHTVTTQPAPAIVNPISKTICGSESTVFSVSLNPSAGFTYQWKVLNSSGIWVNVVNNANYSGATTNTLTVNQAPLSFNGNQYYCYITSATCQINSDAAQLYVVPPPAIPDTIATHPNCTTSTGSIMVNSPTGTGITYSIDGTNFQSGATFTSLSPNTYTITVKNAGGCTSSIQVTINPVPNAPATPDTALTQPTCTTPTGSIVVNSPTGTGLTYSIDGVVFQSGTSFTSLAPNAYTITVKNADGCTNSTTVTINAVPAAPAVPNAVSTQPTCTTPTGSIVVNSPTGSGLTYSIDGSNFQSGTTFATLAPNTYTITIKNPDGCTNSTTVTINAVPAAPAVPNAVATQPTCTTPTGSIVVNSPTGAGFTYSIDGTNFQAGTTFTSLAPNTYTITVKNADGCTNSTTVTINAVPAAPAVPNAVGTQPTCTTPTGSIVVNSPTGTGFSYSIDGTNFQAGTTFTSLSPNTYTITVKNAAGCTNSTTVTINAVPATPAVPNAVATQPTCTTPTGSIVVNSPTGAGFTYSIDGTNFQSGTTFATLAPNTYTIKVKNADGCTNSTTVTINAVLAAPAVPNAVATQPTCTTPTGSIVVNSPTGSGLTYSIDGVVFQSGTSFTSLAPNAYTITVKNASGCTNSTTVTINAVPAAPAVPNAVATQPTCTTPTGSIVVNSPTGTGITYSIDGTNFQSGTTFNSLVPNTYTITVKNAAGCTNSTTVTINAVPAAPAVPNVAATQPTCTTPTGSIVVNSPTGAGLTYSIDGTNFQSGTTFATLAPNTYTITIKNASGCTNSTTVTINTVPASPAVPNVAATQPTCTTPTGSIVVNSPTGTGFTYSIDGTNFQAGNTFTSLAPNTYTITVKNSAGCTNSTTVTINAVPAAPAVPNAVATQPTCTTPTGSIVVNSPTGAGFTYSIDGTNFQGGTTFNSLAPNTYTITVKNAAGCTNSTTVTINAVPAAPAVPNAVATQPTCTTLTGSILVNTPTGTGFTYSIDGTNFQSGTTFNSLVPNTYIITVKNAAGCIASTTVVINNPPAAVPGPGTITGDGQVCQGETIQLTNTVTGGVWSTSNAAIATVSTTGLVTAVANGSVLITYMVGTICTASATKIIRVNALPIPVLQDIFLCKDNITGVISPSIIYSGLSAAQHTFVWTKDGAPLTATSGSITVTEPGRYSVTAVNRTTGCEGIASATVGVSSIATATATVGVDFHNNQTITVSVTGGSGIYEYQLDNGGFQDEPYFTNVTEGEHIVIVKDKQGCGESDPIYVYSLNYPRFFTPNDDSYNDTWNIKGLRDQPESKIYIFDRYGKIITLIKPSGAGWDGMYNGRPLPATDYWFTLSYRSSDGQMKEFKAHFSLKR